MVVIKLTSGVICDIVCVCFQVIGALLSKFTVADNPAKYALYKRYRREEQGKTLGRQMPLMPNSVSDTLAQTQCECV